MGFFARATCLGSIVLTAACSAGGGDGQGATSNGDAESSGEPTSAASTDADGGGSSGGAGSSDGGSDGGSTGGNDDVQVVPLRVDAFNVPTIETYYACFEFSFTLDQLGHIVGFAPQIDDAKHVHHFVLSKLDGPTGQSPGYSCFDLAGEMIYTWAPGGQTWELPPEAGFLIGDGEGGSVTLRLQVHYNNIGGDEGAVDSSGLDLQVARTLRPNNAGTMVFGDIDGIAIPPAMSAYEHVATCSGNATSTLLQEPMHVFGTAMHAHELGRVLWSEVWRDGAMAFELNRDDPYLFSAQHMNPVDLVIEPGDEVQTHCIYDSTDRTETTVGGPGTQDEMCWNVVTYWPRLANPVDTCGTGN